MKMKSESRWPVRIAAAGLILLLVCFAWGMQERRQRVRLQYQTEGFYQKNFHELVRHLDLIAGNLAQTAACVSQEQTVLSLASVWQCSSAAQSNLGALPLTPIQLNRTERFFSQAGDTALWLMKKTAKTREGLSGSEKETLLRLLSDSKQMCTEIEGISAEIMSRDSAFTRAPGQILDRLRLTEQSMDMGVASVGALPERSDAVFLNSGDFIPENFSRYFGVSPWQSRTESGISSAQGAQIALTWWFGSGTNADTADTFEAVLAYEGAGDIPAYGYEIRRAGQNLPLVYVDVTKENGIVLWAMETPGNLSSGAHPPTPANPGAAETLIRVFLESRGYPLMEIVQKEIVQGGILQDPQAGGYGVYTLTPVHGEILLYPDQIKIRVDLNRMTVTGFEGASYYRRHRPRANLDAPLKPQWAKEQIRSLASPLLKIEDIRPALIQDASGEEILTWEVQGKLEDEVLSVFYNAETGAEERIIRRTQPRTYLFAVLGG
jgi:spore germination protein